MQPIASNSKLFTAVAAGVWLHVLAGREEARRDHSAESVIASDVIAALGVVRAGGREHVWRPGGRLADPDGYDSRRAGAQRPADAEAAGR